MKFVSGGSRFRKTEEQLPAGTNYQGGLLTIRTRGSQVITGPRVLGEKPNNGVLAASVFFLPAGDDANDLRG